MTAHDRIRDDLQRVISEMQEAIDGLARMVHRPDTRELGLSEALFAVVTDARNLCDTVEGIDTALCQRAIAGPCAECSPAWWQRFMRERPLLADQAWPLCLEHQTEHSRTAHG